MNTLPKHVATTTLQSLDWNASPIQGDVAAAVTELKRRPGDDILIYGSCELVRTLARAISSTSIGSWSTRQAGERRCQSIS